MVSWSCAAFGVRAGRPPGWPTVAPAAAAASRAARCGPAFFARAVIRPATNASPAPVVSTNGISGSGRNTPPSAQATRLPASATASATSEGPWRSSLAAAFSASAAVVTGDPASNPASLASARTTSATSSSASRPSSPGAPSSTTLPAGPVRQGRGGERRSGRLLQVHPDPPAGQEQVPGGDDVGLGEQHPGRYVIEVAPLPGGVDDVHDERGAHARPASHRGHVDLVLARLGQQALADLIFADHASQRGPHTELGQAHRLIGALAAEQFPALVHVGGPAGGGHRVDDEDQVAGDLAEHDHVWAGTGSGDCGLAGSVSAHDLLTCCSRPPQTSWHGPAPTEPG